MPAHPLVVKSLIFFISDIGGYFKNFPSLLSTSIDYVLTNGLLSIPNSKFYIDSNAIECLRNLSCECLDYFSSEIIYKILQTSETILANVSSSNGDKLIETVMNSISKLPETEKLQCQRKLLSFLVRELQSASPLGLQSQPQVLLKSIILISSAFGTLTEESSKDVWGNLQDIILLSVEESLKALHLYRNSENILVAAYSLFKRIIKVCSTYADCFFINICEAVLSLYEPGKEEGMGVMLIGVSLLFNEEKTKGWLNENYMRIYNMLSNSLGTCQSPDTIVTFFDFQSKLLESGNGMVSSTLVQTLQIASLAINAVTDRNSSKALLSFLCMVFSRRLEELAPMVVLLTTNFMCAMGIISINSFHNLANVFINYRKFYHAEFVKGLTQGLSSDTYTQLTPNEKDRLLFCFINISIDTIQQMKQLLVITGNILKGQANFDSIIAIEIAANSKNIKRTNIEIAN